MSFHDTLDINTKSECKQKINTCMRFFFCVRIRWIFHSKFINCTLKGFLSALFCYTNRLFFISFEGSLHKKDIVLDLNKM